METCTRTPQYLQSEYILSLIFSRSICYFSHESFICPSGPRNVSHSFTQKPLWSSTFCPFSPSVQSVFDLNGLSILLENWYVLRRLEYPIYRFYLMKSFTYLSSQFIVRTSLNLEKDNNYESYYKVLLTNRILTHTVF